MTRPQPGERVRIQKLLSRNDVGATGSHQSGIAIPKTVARLFPALDETLLNPDTQLFLETENAVATVGRYVHYNNRVVSDGTRDEYRITRMGSLLTDLGAKVGDVLEFEALASNRFRLQLLGARPVYQEGAIVIELSRGWRSVRF